MSILKKRSIIICQYRSCERNGANKILEAFNAVDLPNVTVEGSDCMGQCSAGPNVRVVPDRVWYCRVTIDDVSRIIEEHLKSDNPIKDLMHPRFHGFVD
ncbi:2Fe-2S ferredoxin [Geitlerinema sp. PCC 7407]|nr:2Fe-2S ferredoxin [Geitlerinema sp. PCC 7407]